MSLYRFLLRSLHHRRHLTTATQPLTISLLHDSSHPVSTPSQRQSHRTFAFSSAEEAAAERRRRKRRLRIEPPLHALRSQHPSPNDNSGPPRPPTPDTTSALVGPRLNLHNRVQSLIRAFDLDAAALLARRSVFSNIRPTVFTCNAIIAAMYRGKRYDDAIALFQYFFKQNNIIPNIVSYNNLINAHCDKSDVDKALEVYQDIIATAPFSPSYFTYRHLTKGLVETGRIGEAVDLLREMLHKGQGADSLVYNNVIKGFLELGNLERANDLFDELKERCTVYDGVVNATYMDWYFNQGKDKEGMEAYRSLMNRKYKMVPATCNVLLETLLKHGKKAESLILFEQMLDNHTPPNFQAVNSGTFNLMVNECFKLGKFAEAVDTFKRVGTKQGSKPFAMDVDGYNNIIERFCENGMLTEAERFFTELTSKSLSPNVNCYRTLIDTYLKMERIDDALQMLDKMVEARLRVVVGFGTRVFEELIKNGKALDSAKILMKMSEQDPKPDALIYDVVVKGLCHENALDIALNVVHQAVYQNVGITPTLKEFVHEAFGKVGRVEELNNVLLGPRTGGQPHSRPRFQGQQHYGSPHMAGQGQQQFGAPPTIGYPQMAGQGSSGPNQMAGQGQFSSPQASGYPQMAGQGPSGPNQMVGQQQSNYSQSIGQHFPEAAAPQTKGLSSSWVPKIESQPSFVASQTTQNLHSQEVTQTEWQQPAWSSPQRKSPHSPMGSRQQQEPSWNQGRSAMEELHHTQNSSQHQTENMGWTNSRRQ